MVQIILKGALITVSALFSYVILNLYKLLP